MSKKKAAQNQNQMFQEVPYYLVSPLSPHVFLFNNGGEFDEAPHFGAPESLNTGQMIQQHQMAIQQK